MTYQGTVRNGVVVFETAAPPDGTQVHVQPVEQVAVAAETSAKTRTSSIWNKMQNFVGRAEDLPADAARNHDHYLYGKPKR